MAGRSYLCGGDSMPVFWLENAPTPTNQRHHSNQRTCHPLDSIAVIWTSLISSQSSLFSTKNPKDPSRTWKPQRLTQWRVWTTNSYSTTSKNVSLYLRASAQKEVVHSFWRLKARFENGQRRHESSTVFRCRSISPCSTASRPSIASSRPSPERSGVD